MAGTTKVGYTRLGKSGLQVSRLILGETFLTFYSLAVNREAPSPENPVSLTPSTFCT